MSQTEATRQSDWILPPRAGKMAVLSATSTPVSIDLRTIGTTTDTFASADGNHPYGPVGHYVSLYADGGDVYVNFGSTSGSVTGANVPDPTVTGVNAAKGCWKILKDTALQVKLAVGQDLYCGYACASGVTATLRIVQSSP